MPEVQERAPRKRINSRTRPQTPVPNVERSICGRPRLTSSYLTVCYRSGITIQQAIATIRNGDVCLECHIAWLIERGLVEPSVHCDHTFHGIDEAELGSLLASLDSVTLHGRPKITIHEIGGSV
jgi:hypothetical protein